ncbi:hypothetical protein ElyMa_000644100 [Elysia marginata]|uniref:Uncharacterized protein n=1 Tax=Elysia marginata TaxID=1093978 RepID=A0AAV4GDG9_9GAST|nr:hypothetical protein ElyMa_000644100 [Elysia marginata]
MARLQDFFVLCISVTLLGLVESGVEQDSSSITRDPYCSTTHCKKPSYDIIELDSDCSSVKTYARCVKSVLSTCRKRKEKLKDRDSMDNLVMEFDAAKSTLAIVGPNCAMWASVDPLNAARPTSPLAVPEYIGLGLVTFYLSRSNPQGARKKGRPQGTWRRSVESERVEQGRHGTSSIGSPKTDVNGEIVVVVAVVAAAAAVVAN